MRRESNSVRHHPVLFGARGGEHRKRHSRVRQDMEKSQVSDPCPKCGEPVEDHQKLNHAEYKAVTQAFMDRLREAMGSAGCNDVFPDEFPSVYKRFRSDLELLEAWEEFHSRCICEDLKTEAGKVAFAMTIGWPLPEELIAAKRQLAIQEDRIEELKRAHEDLLITLGPSKSPWIAKVHKSASAYYDTWKTKTRR